MEPEQRTVLAAFHCPFSITKRVRCRIKNCNAPFLIEDVSILGEESLHRRHQPPVLRLRQTGVGLQQLCRGVLGLLQHPGIPRQVGSPHGGQTVLPLAKEIAGSPHLQVLLRDLEAVGGGAEVF